MTRLARHLGVTRRELLEAVLRLPLVIVVVIGTYVLCAMFVAAFS